MIIMRFAYDYTLWWLLLHAVMIIITRFDDYYYTLWWLLLHALMIIITRFDDNH